MEVCAGFELIAIERTTALGDDVLEIGQGLDVPVGEWLILASGSSWRVAHPGRATGVLRAEAQANTGAGNRAGCHPARPGWVRCASRRWRARVRRCAPVPPRPRGQTAPAARRRTAWTLRSIRTRTPRRRSAARRRSRTATYSGGDRGRWAAAPWAPRPGARSASARCGARRSPRPRSACPGAGPAPRRQPVPAFFEPRALLRRGRAGGGGGACARTSRSPSGPPSRVGARPPRARVRPPSRPPPLGPSTGPRRTEASQVARATAPEAQGAARSVRCRYADASHPGPRGHVRCSGPAVARSSAARSSSPRRHPRSCDLALTARSPESAASRSDPGPTGTPLPSPLRSDDQQHAPCFASATHGAPAYPLPNNPGILSPSLSPGIRMTAKFAALAPFGKVAALLSELLPISGAQNAGTVRNRTLRVGHEVVPERPIDPARPPAAPAAGPVVVGLDGGSVRSRHRQEERRFEVV